MKMSDAVENSAGGKLFNFRPVLFSAAFFALGIAFAYGRRYFGLSFWWLTAGVPAFVLALLFSAAKRKAAAVCAALALCFALGTLGFSAEISAFAEGSRYSGEYAVTGTVAEKKEYDKISVLLLENVTIGGTKEQGKINATLPASLSASVAVADKVTVFGKVETNTEAFDDYGFRAEEVSGRVRFQIDVSSLTVTGKSKNPFLAVRSRLVETLYAGMDEESAAVTCALLTGDTSGIESGLLENVRRGGIAHIFAVSGLHIGALYAFCLFLFRKTKLSACPRGIKFFLVAALLFFYGGVCGFSPSVVRACVMCIVLYAHMLIGVKSDLLESAGLAALLLLLVRPSFLFEVGFQLSFAACLSIGVLSRPLKRLSFKIFKVKEEPYLGERVKKSVASFVSVSLAAQLGTAPVLLDTFGYISLWSLLLNGVFVPLVGAVFAGLLAIAFVAAMLPLAAAPVLLYVPSVLWSAVLLVFHAFDFSLPAIQGWRFGRGAVLYYAALCAASDKINLSAKARGMSALLLAAGTVLAVVGINL